MRIEPRVLVACTLLGIAPLNADPDDASRNWDNKYLHKGAGGTWPCPEAKTDFTTDGGKFSIPWDVNVYVEGQGEKTVTLGHIEGHVRANGSTEVTSRLVSPLPRPFVDQAQQYKIAPEALGGYKFTVLFDHDYAGTTATVKGKDCTASWHGDPDKPWQPAGGGEVDCSKGAYAVPQWNATKRYDAGGYTTVPVEGEASRVFRCTHGCAAGKSPNDGDAAWSLIGHCALDALPKDGSPKWDVAYRYQGGGSSDWRCPKFEQDGFKVSHGRFSIPWRLHSGIDVGRIDGVVLADGRAVVHPVVTINDLTRDTAVASDSPIDRQQQNAGRDGRSIEQLKAAVPTLKFMRDTRENNPRGVGRRAEFQLGGENNCDGYFYAADYKEQQVREREGNGWRVECHDDQVWDSKRSYDNGESASVVMSGSLRRLFRCAQSPRCDAGQRPDRSNAWTEEGRCQ
jgi:hypothetical protein